MSPSRNRQTLSAPRQSDECRADLAVRGRRHHRRGEWRAIHLGDANHDGRIDSVELSSKALLLDVQGKSGGRKFQVNTPQAIAAVRGTRWAVDVAEGKTSVFVVHGRVKVGRRSPGDRQVVLGPGEGVDVEAAAPLVVKRWAPARVSALMARLGQ